MRVGVVWECHAHARDGPRDKPRRASPEEDDEDCEPHLGYNSGGSPYARQHRGLDRGDPHGRHSGIKFAYRSPERCKLVARGSRESREEDLEDPRCGLERIDEGTALLPMVPRCGG